MTYLRKLGTLELAVFILILILIFLKHYIISIILCILPVFIGVIWHKELREEMIIYTLYKNGYSMKYEDLIKELPKSEKALERMKQKNKIRIDDNDIHLLLKEYKFSIKRTSIKR